MTEQRTYGMFLNKADTFYRYQRYKQQSLGRIPTSNLTPPYFFFPCDATGVGLEIPPGKIKDWFAAGFSRKIIKVPNRLSESMNFQLYTLLSFYRKEKNDPRKISLISQHQTFLSRAPSLIPPHGRSPLLVLFHPWRKPQGRRNAWHYRVLKRRCGILDEMVKVVFSGEASERKCPE